jgi:hypothetical protein
MATSGTKNTPKNLRFFFKNAIFGTAQILPGEPNAGESAASCQNSVKFPTENRPELSINLAVSSKCPMIDFVGTEEPTKKELSAVFPAEGPIFALAKVIKVASAEARSIFASLAAAPLFLPPTVGSFE